MELQVTDQSIIEEHKLAQSSAKSAVEHAVNCGRMLNERKAQTKHGEWLPLLKSLGIPDNTAGRYMKAAKAVGEGKSASLANLTISDLLGEERKAREKKVKRKGPEWNWIVIPIEMGLVTGRSGSATNKLRAKILEIDQTIDFGEESCAASITAACQQLAGIEAGGWRDDKTKRQVSSTDVAIEREVQERTNAAIQEMLDIYNTEFDKYRAFNQAYRGVFTQKEYKALLSALHSDRYQGLDDVQRGRLERAFALVKDKELELCGEASNESSTLPKTVSELMAMRKSK